MNWVSFHYCTWVKKVSKQKKCVFSAKYSACLYFLPRHILERFIRSLIRLQRVLNNSCMYNKSKHMRVCWFIHHNFPNGFRQSPIFPLTTVWIHYSCWHFHHPTSLTSTLNQYVNTHHEQWLLFLYWPGDWILMCWRL